MVNQATGGRDPNPRHTPLTSLPSTAFLGKATKEILRLPWMLTFLSFFLFPCESSNFKFIINEELPFCMLSGTIVLKSNVKEFTETSAIFEDGTTEENIDVVIFATGYNFSFSFLEESICNQLKSNRTLYKCVFPPQLERPTLAVIGLIQLTGSVMVGAEIQARWVTGVFAGERETAGIGEVLRREDRSPCCSWDHAVHHHMLLVKVLGASNGKNDY